MKYLIALLFVISITFSQSSLAASFQDELKKANQGNPEAQYMLGLKKAVRQDYAEAIKWFKLAADQGNPGAQSNLGFLYENGFGVRQDYAEAFKWYKLSADQGNAYGQFYLGTLYFYGQGVRQDYVEAKEWFGKSCDNGFQMGCKEYRALNNL